MATAKSIRPVIHRGHLYWQIGEVMFSSLQAAVGAWSAAECHRLDIIAGCVMNTPTISHEEAELAATTLNLMMIPATRLVQVTEQVYAWQAVVTDQNERTLWTGPVAHFRNEAARRDAEDAVESLRRHHQRRPDHPVRAGGAS